ncbi:MAG: PDZ domain-containing protein [Nocardioides sp.]
MSEARRGLLPKTWTLLIGFPLFLALWIAALLLPMPYVTYAPGLTTDVLGQQDGKEIISVTGHKTYRDDGQLRMTTVYVSQPGARVNIFQVLGAYLDDEQAVYPYASIYRPDETRDEARRESALQMVSSQDLAVAAALREMGYDLPIATKVQEVTTGMPADGALKVGDQLVRVQGKRIRRPQQVLTAVKDVRPGDQVTLEILRDGKPLTVKVDTVAVEGKAKMGIVPGPSYEFPFDVHVNIPPNIGGPSAGLMFSLAIYDTLTPGSLTDDQVVAGTGTIDESGKVGPIGGIAQKIVAARDAGASLFFVPPDNCDEAAQAEDEGLNENMVLVKATTMHDAVASVEKWTADNDASLPMCTAADIKAAS